MLTHAFWVEGKEMQTWKGNVVLYQLKCSVSNTTLHVFHL